ncbi:MAG: DNA integrity scanning diadenylate cyclase DisA [Candidatus Nanopelagicales bacterium]|jgi:diadenylate cyclase|nr:DNA integrity scanning diadenylate cyclase DisA [Candidatus Nanopelagicales bacterium]
MAAVDPELAVALARVAPGTELRDGLERILRGRTGALIVLGHDRTVEGICTGGFPLDIDFTATRLRELAKMDGAVIIDSTSSRIVRAATQLVPDPTISTGETGTRHRTADRVARQTGYPVISVSKSMHIIALYLKGRRYVLEDPAAILSRANQALATLERYKQRLDEVSRSLSALEIEDLVTVREVCATLQRLEMVRHIASEIRAYLLELGTEGRLVALQLAELVAGVESDRELVVRDYLPGSKKSTRKQRTVEGSLEALDLIGPTDLLELTSVSRAIGYPASADTLEDNVSPRGHRMLARVPRVPEVVRERLVEHFGSLQALLGASVDDLQQVEGIGENRARYIREGLSRLAESSILERYV